MRVGQKLVLGFLSIALLVGVVGYISVNRSQKALEKAIKESSVSLAVGILDKIDRDIYSKIERFQSFADPSLQKALIESNQEFEKLDNIQNYINEKDREWTSVPNEEITPFMKDLINNELSKALRKRIRFYEEKYGFKVFPEVFVTNKYGANVAQTGKTSDYYQADENWWQNAPKEGFYVEDVEYDRSAEVYSTAIGIRIDDEKGNLSGVIKAVLNIEETINILEETKAAAEYATTEFKLITKDGKIIYSTEGRGVFKNTSDKLLSRFHQGEEHIEYFIEEGDHPGKGEELFAHVSSKGYRDFKGLGWILVIEHETKEIFIPIARLRYILLTISAIITTFAVLIGLYISRSISTPITKLKEATIEIGKGKLDTEIGVTSNDEIGLLAASFKKMVEDLKTTTTSIDKLNKEIAGRKQAEDNIKAVNQQLRANEQQLKATNQQLDARNQQLQASEQQLKAANQQLQASEQQLRMLNYNLGERVKELGCMYSLVNSIQEMGSLEEILQDAVTFIARSWQYPENTRCKIRFDRAEYVSEPFEETQWKQTSDIIVDGEQHGTVEVYYMEERPEADEGPFLKEERYLIDAVAVTISEAVVRKRTEEKLLDLAKFPSENPNPVFRISKDYEILYANSAGLPILDAWKCKEGQRLQGAQCKLVEKVFNSGKAVTFELDCSDKVFSVTIAPVVKHGYINVYGLDVTELKVSKENLKRSKEQAKIKSQFVSMVSHELRTPLASMKESTNIVLDGLVGEINDQQCKFLDITKRNIDRLARLINDVLDFQKLEMGKMAVDLRQHDMNELVKETQHTMTPLANEKGVQLIARVDETLPAVNIDRDKIIQVLTNLLDNAIKFTDKGSVTITVTKDDDKARVSVRDTGAGIKKEHLPKLFHEFEQLSDANERKIGGTGLGLVISKKIIEKHNGKIWAKSELGKGTTLNFVLPIK